MVVVMMFVRVFVLVVWVAMYLISERVHALVAQRLIVKLLFAGKDDSKEPALPPVLIPVWNVLVELLG